MTRYLDQLIEKQNLSVDDASGLLKQLCEPDHPESVSGAVLTALRMKGETPEEILGFARAMRSLAVTPQLGDTSDSLDIVGTGGDGSNSVNISTGAALLSAASGIRVIKHGNRAVSSKSGSADVLEALGFRIPESDSEHMTSLYRLGFTFLFAPLYHPALKKLSGVRRSLRTRTVFNILGPLTNPAAPGFAVIGAFDIDRARLMADALAGLDLTRAFVVHGTNGWDEATSAGEFHLFDVNSGRVAHEVRSPEDYDCARCNESALGGGTAGENAAALTTALSGDSGPLRDTLVINASLALEVTGRAGTPRAGAEIARETIDSGAAADLLSRMGPSRMAAAG